MANSTIMALVVENREGFAPLVQKILTDNGCMIKTRLGMHDACENKGLILLHLSGSGDDVKSLGDDLTKIKGVSIKTMEIDF